MLWATGRGGRARPWRFQRQELCSLWATGHRGRVRPWRFQRQELCPLWATGRGGQAMPWQAQRRVVSLVVGHRAWEKSHALASSAPRVVSLVGQKNQKSSVPCGPQDMGKKPCPGKLSAKSSVSWTRRIRRVMSLVGHRTWGTRQE